MRATTLLTLLLVCVVHIFPAYCGTSQSHAVTSIPPEWQPLAERLEQDGFKPEFLRIVFSDPALVFDTGPMARKANALLRAKLRAEQPGTVAPLPELHHRYLKPANLRAARDFLDTHRELMDTASQIYHIPVEVLTALFLVETNLGRVTGKHNTACVLACMAAVDSLEQVEPHLKNKNDLTDDLRPWLDKRIKDKNGWAYEEFSALLAYARDNTISPLEIKGSVYGAFGLCQFMPSNAVKFGVDGDSDGKVDLFEVRDALMSMANYLKGHGWTPDMNRRPPAIRLKDGKQKFDPEMIKVIWEYNHSLPYSRTILAVADELGRTPTAR